jgi:hypothetical protein
MKLTAVFLLLFSGSAWSAGNRLFPLEVGNLWVYESAGSRCCTPLILEVTDSSIFKGNRYFLVHSSAGGDNWLRAGDGDSVFAYDAQADQESLWYSFQTPEGQTFSTAIPNSSGLAMIAGHSAYSGPSGAFDTAVTIAYPGTIQKGFAREVFVQDVGLVQRIEYTGDAALASYQLVYARMGGSTLQPSPTPSSGVAGRVLRGPICPVQRFDDPACADQPAAAVLSIQTADRSHEVAVTASDQAGNFRLTLPPGDYVMVFQTLNGSKFPSSIPQTVTVLPNNFANVSIRLDTGIR